RSDHAVARVRRIDEIRRRRDCRLSQKPAAGQPQGAGPIWIRRQAARAQNDGGLSRQQLAPSPAITRIHMIPAAGQYVAELNDVELGYTIIGKGPPLLVVAPGWGIGSHYLQRGLAPLAVRFTMIFVDPRGSGRSGRPADNAAMNSAVMAEDIH